MNNIWKKFNFNLTQKKGKSAYEYLREQEEGLFSLTSGLLRSEINRRYTTLCDENSIVYDCYIIADKLGGYKIKIFTIVEPISNHFPVVISSELDDELIFTNVEEKDFLETVGKILSSDKVSHKINYLYSTVKSFQQ